MPKSPPASGPEKLRIRDFLITDEFDCVRAGSEVRETVRKLLDMKRGVVLVKGSSDKVVGVVTERKILKGIVDVKQDPLSSRVDSVMDTNIMIISRDDELVEALEGIKKNRPAAVIVNDKDGNFVGYFSPIDFIEAESKLRNILKR
ncbi:MAG: CBS domain-containing protein [Euryarchaeota archaeon]|nr:CBS domain-containing protein [Euryarchaeota archaeon]